jgi:flagellar motor switch protein FliN/FliY
MSDGSLSQDEIDALLQGTDDIVDTSAGAPPSGGVMTGEGPLSGAEVSAFQDLLNTASSNEGEALGVMVQRTVTLSNPRIEVVSFSDLQSSLPGEVVEVKMDYDAGVTGEHLYCIDPAGAQVLAGLMMGQDSVELSEQSLSAISEAMNIMTGNASTTIGTQVKKEIRTTPPTINKKASGELSLSQGGQFVKVTYDFTIEGFDPIQLVEVFGVSVVKEITADMVPAGNDVGSASPGGDNSMMGQPGMMNMGQPPMGGQPNMGQPGMMNMGQQGMMNMGQQGMMNMGQQGMMNMNNMPSTQVQNIQFSNFSDQQFDGQAGNINLLMDVTMELTVELGRTKKSIKDILGMGEGTVIELDKLAGEPVDILVNGKLIARGEVVVIDENFGVRVTEIISPMDRIQDLT